MIISLPLESNDIRRQLSSSELILFDKGCCRYTSTVPKDKYEEFSANCLKMLTFVQSGATLTLSGPGEGGRNPPP